MRHSGAGRGHLHHGIGRCYGQEPPGGGGPVAFVQSASAFSGTASSLAKAFTSNVTAGDLIVVAVQWQDTGNGLGNLPTISDTQTNSYSLAVDIAGGISAPNAILYATAKATGACTVTATFVASPTTIRLGIHEYSGATTVGPVSSTAADGRTSSLTTTTPNSVVFAWAISSGGNSSVSAPFTLRQTISAESTADDVVTATGTYTVVFSGAGGSTGTVLMAAFHG